MKSHLDKHGIRSIITININPLSPLYNMAASNGLAPWGHFKLNEVHQFFIFIFNIFFSFLWIPCNLWKSMSSRNINYAIRSFLDPTSVSCGTLYIEDTPPTLVFSWFSAGKIWTVLEYRSRLL